MKTRWILVFLLGALSACSTKVHMKVNVSDKSPEGLFSIVQNQPKLKWQTDTLAVVTWWNAEGKVESQAVIPGDKWTIRPSRRENGYNLECAQAGASLSFRIELKEEGDVFTVNVPADEIRESGLARIRSIRLLPFLGAACEGEEGYLVFPKEVGAICLFRNKKPGEYKHRIYSANGMNMPLFGMVRGKAGFAGFVTSGQFDAQFCIHTRWGAKPLYSIDTEFILRSFRDEKQLTDDLTVEYHFLEDDEATWAGIGRCYRQYNLDHRGIRPIKQRMAGSPELAYAAEAMEVRLRLGVKPVPYEIKEQTLETEPPVRAFLTFSQVRNIFDEFHRQGINQAEFCLVGWNIGGHDGRYPQIFPVEPSLGGEEELRKTVDYGQSLGYQVVAHNCYWDSYRIAQNWDESFVRKKADGQLWKGDQWGGGQSYLQCLSRSYDLFAKHDLLQIRELGFRGLHYTDVLSLVSPLPCYDPSHMETRRQDAEAANRILALSDSLFGGVQSEGPLDYTAAVLDRFLYTSIHPQGYSQTELPYLDENIPLYAIVYHGFLTYNLDNRTFNSLPGENEYLENIEYGGIPAAYFYGHFYMEGSGRKNWIGNRDYRYSSPDELKTAVSGLKQVYDDFQQLKHLQLEFVEGHRKLGNGIHETLYGNGESVIVNYNTLPLKLASGETVPAKGFLLKK